MKPSTVVPFSSLLAVMIVTAFPSHRVEGKEQAAIRSSAAVIGKHKLIAVMHPAGGGHVEGTVLFEKYSGGIRVTARIGGLRPNSIHGIRIRGASNRGATFTGTRDVLEPGDLGNLMSDADGNATHVMDLDTRSFGKDGIFGLTVTVHENGGSGEWPDEDAGDPIGVGVIRTAK